MNRTATRTLTVLAALCLAVTGLSACGSGSGGDSDSLTIQVDYAHDEFAGSLFGFFPNKVTVNPGTTLKFKQTWTGEPHTVTMGTRVTELAKPFKKVLDGIFDTGVVTEEPQGYQAFDEGLPSFFGQDIGQAAAQPCYAKTVADLPLDGTACPTKKLQPFNGDEAYYSSGFIPFEGLGGNTFELPIAADAKPGTYLYYCNAHGAPMGGYITVTEDGEVSKQAALNRQAKVEADRTAKVLLETYRDEKAGKGKIKGNLAGSGDDRTEEAFGTVNEFTPRTIETKVGDKVTWTFVGYHTISFNVPPYAPVFKIAKNGKVSFNAALDEAAGGWPGRNPPTPDDYREDPPVVAMDAGTFDGGGGLKSSGTDWVTGDKYSVTFTKKGTYPYACIVHPGMIGKVVVK
jgi:plastocyanin